MSNLRSRIKRLRGLIGAGEMWDNVNGAGLCTYGFTGDPTRADQKAHAPGGVKRLAVVASLRGAVCLMRRPARYRAEGTRDPAELARADRDAAEAAETLGVAVDASDDEIVTASLKAGYDAGMTAKELEFVRGTVRSMLDYERRESLTFTQKDNPCPA